MTGCSSTPPRSASALGTPLHQQAQRTDGLLPLPQPHAGNPRRSGPRRRIPLGRGGNLPIPGHITLFRLAAAFLAITDYTEHLRDKHHEVRLPY